MVLSARAHSCGFINIGRAHNTLITHTRYTVYDATKVCVLNIKKTICALMFANIFKKNTNDGLVE